MFDTLSQRLSKTVQDLRGRGRITEENIGETLREVRMALLEADVALPVVRSFIEAVKQKALGAEVVSSLTPGQVFVSIIHRELVELMGGARAGFELRAQPPYVVLQATRLAVAAETGLAYLQWQGARAQQGVAADSLASQQQTLDREVYPAGPRPYPIAVRRERARRRLAAWNTPLPSSCCSRSACCCC